MTQEEKQLLLKDLCSRLPYRVMFKYKGEYGEEPEPQILFELNNVMVNTHYELEGCKPYLRSMSSMTMEDLQNLSNAVGLGVAFDDEKYELWLKGHTTILDNSLAIDWLNSHHFDYRGLIECGLAIEAPEGMYDF